MPEFYRSDLIGLASGILVGIPIIVLPGYAFGWWLRPLSFRSEPPLRRLGTAVICGISMLPVIIFLAFRLISVRAAWVVLVALIVAGMLPLVRRESWPTSAHFSRAGFIAAACWLLLTILLTLDVTSGHRLYPSSAVIDTNVRSQVTASLARSAHLPPQSFFSYPAHPVPLHYHYLLYLLGALMVRILPGLITARMALSAITFWTGLSLLALVGRLIEWADVPVSRRRVLIAWGLLLVGGLDILPVGAEIIRRWYVGQTPILPLPDIEWWNGRAQVFSWLDTAIWHPHHIAALVACLLAGLLLHQSSSSSGTQRWLLVCGASLALASAAGVSVLVAFVFAIFLLIVTIELLLNSPRHAVPLIAAGALSLLLVYPFIRDMSALHPNQVEGTFAIALRPFQPINTLFGDLRIRSPLAWNLAYVLALPVNYLLELGIFFIVGLWWLNERRSLGYRDKLKEHLLIGLLSVSLLLVTFVQSGTVAANDFGYRGILPAQFVLLLFASEFFDRYWKSPPALNSTRRVYQTAVVALLLGSATTIFGVFILRHSIGFADPGVGMYHVSLRLPGSAERLYDLREGYTWIRLNAPLNSVVQEDPLSWQTLAAQYGERRTAIYSWFEAAQILASVDSPSPAFNAVLRLFQPGINSAEKNNSCRSRLINYIVVQDSDPIWHDRKSYIWTEEPVFASPRVRIFRCGDPSAS